jgi:hypothetical protein
MTGCRRDVNNNGGYFWPKQHFDRLFRGCGGRVVDCSPQAEILRKSKRKQELRKHTKTTSDGSWRGLFVMAAPRLTAWRDASLISY